MIQELRALLGLVTYWLPQHSPQAPASQPTMPHAPTQELIAKLLRLAELAQVMSKAEGVAEAVASISPQYADVCWRLAGCMRCCHKGLVKGEQSVQQVSRLYVEVCLVVTKSSCAEIEWHLAQVCASLPRLSKLLCGMPNWHNYGCMMLPSTGCGSEFDGGTPAKLCRQISIIASWIHRGSFWQDIVTGRVWCRLMHRKSC